MAFHKPKVVIITGASSGIGEACALLLDKRGFRVFAGVRREIDGIALRAKASGRLTTIYLDVTSQKSIEQALLQISLSIRPEAAEIDLVNNAGVPLGGPIEFLSLDEMRKELEVNLIGTVAVTQAFLPLIRSSRGRIVNMSSISGLISYPFTGPYSASKFALEAISDSLRIELRPWGITVSLIEPGDVDTPLWEKTHLMIGRMVRHWPPQAFRLYGGILPFQDRLVRRHGIAVEQVAKAVEHALTARHPRPRYRVGQFSSIIDLFRHLPPGIRDRIIASQLPQYGSEK